MWLFAAIIFFAITKLHDTAFKVGVIITFICIIGISFASVPVISGCFEEPSESPDYIIVLGAKADGRNPSLILKSRLDKAEEIYENNKKAKIVVTGGQGADEIITEAECMKDYLMISGIPEDAIIYENKAESTQENMEFSAKLIDENADSVIVTSEFHVRRALKIAENCGYSNVSAAPAHTQIFLLPNYILRETTALILNRI